jgi:hypothetical protein
MILLKVGQQFDRQQRTGRYAVCLRETGNITGQTFHVSGAYADWPQVIKMASFW